MTIIGYAAALEQFAPTELLNYSILAEQHGFKGVMAADHFQPWVPQQGNNAFVWSWMAALGQASKTLSFGPGVTCPSFRFHPAIVAQAAATQAAMTPGRFWLGLGSGEALTEHVIGGVWPEPHVRLKMMQEAIEIIKKLFSGKVTRHDDGKYFTMERVRLWTLPERPAPIYVATAGPITAKWTGENCDGFITPGAGIEKLKGLLDAFEKGAPVGKDPADAQALAAHVLGQTYEEASNARAVAERGCRFQKPISSPRTSPRSPSWWPELQEPYADLARPRRAPRPDPAVRRPGLRRDPCPQRRPQPGAVHQGLRRAGDPQAALSKA
jgi:G6PDH family F420-dependent oxidoreductase